MKQLLLFCCLVILFSYITQTKCPIYIEPEKEFPDIIWDNNGTNCPMEFNRLCCNNDIEIICYCKRKNIYNYLFCPKGTIQTSYYNKIVNKRISYCLINPPNKPLICPNGARRKCGLDIYSRKYCICMRFSSDDTFY